MRSLGRRWLRQYLVGIIAVAGVLAVLYGPALVPHRRSSVEANGPVLPTTIAPYSWFTGKLSAHRMEAASLLYENGFGVEFMDHPQAVLLGADGSTYRRLGAAEAASIAADQGDPATSELSPDGTFVVIGSSAATGTVEVVTLEDGHRRTLPTLARQATLPLSIGADGRTVILATSRSDVNRYAVGSDLGLARLDLTTGAVHAYPAIRHVEGAALSPDGSRLAVAGEGVTRILDAATGEVRASFPTSDSTVLDGDAWSPDGRRLALVDQSSTEEGGADLVVVDVSGATPVERGEHLDASAYGAAAIGWRDDGTVLVHTQTDPDANTSEMVWVDTATGAATQLATYRPDAVTWAAMGRVDAARNLVATWHVADRPVDRGLWPLRLGLGAAALAGILALALDGLRLTLRRPASARRRTPREARPVPPSLPA